MYPPTFLVFSNRFNCSGDFCSPRICSSGGSPDFPDLEVIVLARQFRVQAWTIPARKPVFKPLKKELFGGDLQADQGDFKSPDKSNQAGFLAGLSPGFNRE